MTPSNQQNVLDGDKWLRIFRRDSRFMERMLDELPTYWADLPEGARHEISQRISRLRKRADEFEDALWEDTIGR